MKNEENNMLANFQFCSAAPLVTLISLRSKGLNGLHAISPKDLNIKDTESEKPPPIFKVSMRIYEIFCRITFFSTVS